MEERASENGGMKEKMKSFFLLKREKRGLCVEPQSNITFSVCHCCWGPLSGLPFF